MQNQKEEKIIEDILFIKTYFNEENNTLFFENTSDCFFWKFRVTEGLDDLFELLDDELMREQEVYFQLFTSDKNYLAFFSDTFRRIRDGIYFELKISNLLNSFPNIVEELKEYFLEEYGPEDAEFYFKTIDFIFDVENYEIEEQQLTSFDFYKSYENIKANEMKQAYLLGIGIPMQYFDE